MAKTFKKITALFLTMLMVFGLFSVVPVVAASSAANCTVLVPEEAATHTCKSTWEERIPKLVVTSKYPGTTVQVGDHDTTDLTVRPGVGENLVQSATLYYKKNSGDATYDAVESLTNNKIYTVNDTTEKVVSVGCLDPDTTVKGTARVEQDLYDFTVVMDLGKKTSIDKIYSFSLASVVHAWAIYKIYVSDTQEDLWNEENEVAYFNYFDGYAPNGTASQNYKLNGCWNDLANSEGQIWNFTAEKPLGQYVGYKVYETGKVGNCYFYCSEIGVNGTPAEAPATTYTVTYMDGETVVDTITVEEGKTIANIPAVPAKTGKTGSWDLDLTDVAITENKVVNAVYEDVYLNVTFKAEGEADIVKNVIYGGTLTDIPEAPAKYGYTEAWDVTDFTNITEDVVVTAVYTAKANNCTIKFESVTGKLLGEVIVEEGNVPSEVPEVLAQIKAINTKVGAVYGYTVKLNDNGDVFWSSEVYDEAITTEVSVRPTYIADENVRTFVNVYEVDETTKYIDNREVRFDSQIYLQSTQGAEYWADAEGNVLIGKATGYLYACGTVMNIYAKQGAFTTPDVVFVGKDHKVDNGFTVFAHVNVENATAYGVIFASPNGYAAKNDFEVLDTITKPNSYKKVEIEINANGAVDFMATLNYAAGKNPTRWARAYVKVGDDYIYTDAICNNQ